MGGAGRKTAPPVGQPSAPRRRLDSRGRRSAATLSCAARRSWNRDVTSYGCGTRDAQCFRKYRSHSLACGSHDCVVVLPRSTNRAPVVYRTRSCIHTVLPPARGAPQAPQAARSAAVGGGQQVRKIKRHFWFRGFATNIEIRYKSTHEPKQLTDRPREHTRSRRGCADRHRGPSRARWSHRTRPWPLSSS